MAIQTSDITLSGKMGDLVHYTRKGKKLTRKAPRKYNFSEDTKKTSSEFGTASSAGALIRKGFYPFISLVNRNMDEGLVNRINSKVVSIIGTGPAAAKGNRKVADGDVSLLSDFELNAETRLGALFPVTPEITVDPLDGILIMLPSFKTEEVFTCKYKTSVNAVISIISCTLDFPGKNGRMSVAEDLVLPVKDAVFPGGTLEFPLDTADERVLIVGICVYFQSADGQTFNNRRFMAAQLVKAALLRNGKIVPFIYPDAPEPQAKPAASASRVAWKLKQNNTDKGLENPPPSI